MGKYSERVILLYFVLDNLAGRGLEGVLVVAAFGTTALRYALRLGGSSITWSSVRELGEM